MAAQERIGDGVLVKAEDSVLATGLQRTQVEWRMVNGDIRAVIAQYLECWPNRDDFGVIGFWSECFDESLD